MDQELALCKDTDPRRIHMLYRLRQRSQDESGFTLIELLVVILIIGILAAIAIPSFLGQKQKASDASAKVQARTLETAMETAATDNNGAYEEGGTGVKIARLEEIEPTLKDHTQNTPKVESANSNEYEVASENAVTKDVFKIKRESTGVVKRTCENSVTKKGGTGACPTSGDW
jgi:type IV pilus assembly protein PilA